MAEKPKPRPRSAVASDPLSAKPAPAKTAAPAGVESTGIASAEVASELTELTTIAKDIRGTARTIQLAMIFFVFVVALYLCNAVSAYLKSASAPLPQGEAPPSGLMVAAPE